MGLGVSILLIAAGAILAFAVNTNVSGVDIQTIGWVARTGRIPLGYFDDEAATTKTFAVVDGRRVMIAGER